jgi:lysozyme
MMLADKTRQIQRWAGVQADGVYGRQTADAIIAKAGIGHNAGPALDDKPATSMTTRIMLEIIEHEAIVLEAYKDSEGVWTWGVGVTNASGHIVSGYKDNPQTMRRVLEVYEWLLRTKYLPGVLEAFNPMQLTEAQLGAALSFHWNTGAIGHASWVQSFKAGKRDQAFAEMLNWSKPKSIIPRRKLERQLFFEGKWSSDGLVTVYQRVSKPSYSPDWSSARQIDIQADLRAVIDAAKAGG